MNTESLRKKIIASLGAILIITASVSSGIAARRVQPEKVNAQSLLTEGQPAPDAQDVVDVRQSVIFTVDHHPQIKGLQENRQAAVHDVSRARSGWLPRVDARAGVGFQQWSDVNSRSTVYNYSPNSYHKQFEWSVTFRQTLWDGLATYSRVNAGESTLESLESRLIDNTEGLSLDAIRAHVEVYRQRRIVSLAERNVENHNKILGSQKQRQRVGASSLADVTQTESRLARAQSTLADSRSNLELAIANYKRLTGREDIGELTMVLSPQDTYPSLDAALASARANNPKIKALMADIKTVDAQKELGKANFHPQIYIEGGPSYQWYDRNGEGYSWGNSIMLRATWNLFDGLYDWYNLKGNKARLRQARQGLVDIYESLAQETESTWSQLISAHEQTRFFANAVEYSAQTRDMYQDQFNLGQRSLLDVLDSENELYSSSLQYVTASQNEIIAQYKLLALGGELLKSFQIDRSRYIINTDERAKNNGDDNNPVDWSEQEHQRRLREYSQIQSERQANEQATTF